MVVKLEAHPEISIEVPTPWRTMDVEATLPVTTTVPAPEGIVSVVALVELAVQTPAIQKKSMLGRLFSEHVAGVGVGGTVGGEGATGAGQLSMAQTE